MFVRLITISIVVLIGGLIKKKKNDHFSAIKIFKKSIEILKDFCVFVFICSQYSVNRYNFGKKKTCQIVLFVTKSDIIIINVFR